MRNKQFVNSLIFIFLIIISMQISVFGKEQWIQVKTDNFTLIGNTDEKQITKVGIKLEQFRESLRRLVPGLSADSPISTTVIVFKDDNSFKPFKPVNSEGKIMDWVAGFFQAGLDKNYIALSFEKKNENYYQTIFHEYTHYLIDYNIGRSNMPPWFSEGLAEYYDQFSVSQDSIVQLGGENRSHLEILKSNELIPLETFFNTDYETFRLQNKHKANLFYAQSWALIHYFMRDETGKRKIQLDNFMRLILNKEPTDKAFKKAFGMTILELETRLLNYISYGNFKPAVTKFDKKLTSNITIVSKTLLEYEVEAILGDLHYQRERFDEAEIHLKKSLELNPDSSFPMSTLGLIRFKQNKFADAGNYLKRAIELNEKDYLVYFRYAYFLSREVMTVESLISTYSDERALEMQNALKRSIELNPNFPESYRLLGFINLVKNEKFEDGIEYLKKAVEISPTKQIYQILLAELYVRNKDYLNSKIIAENIVSNPEEPYLKSKAVSILNNINFIQEQIALSKTKKQSIKSETSFEPANLDKDRRTLTEEELERNRKQTESEKISEVLRKPKIGEKRIVGQITSVECVKNKIIFTIISEYQIQKLEIDDFRKILMRTFTSEMRGVSLDCGIAMNDVRAVLIYKPFENSLEQIKGEIIAIEFVPKNFELTSFAKED